MTSSTSRQIAAYLVFSASVAVLGGCGKPQTATSLVADARQYQQKGDLKAAIIQLKNALIKNPSDAEARFLLGTVYLDSGDPAAAESDLQKAIALGMRPDTVAPYLGKALMQLGKYEQALDAMPVPATGIASTALLTGRGAALLALGKNAQAKTAFEQALTTEPNAVDALLGLVRYASQTGDSASAMRYADQAVAANPSSIEALLAKGDQLRAVGNGAAAMAAYNQALKLKPDSLPVLLARATTRIGSGKFDDAKQDLDTARKLAPTALLVLYTQALLDFTQNKYPAALDSLQQVLRVAPDNMPTVLLAGATQAAMGGNAQAEQYLRRYLEANPDSIYTRKLLGSVLTKSGQTERAMQILTPPLSEVQNDPQLLMLAGETLLQAKNYGAASEYFERANTLAPETVIGHTALAMSSLGQGDRSKAISELELAETLTARTSTPSPERGILLVMTRLQLKQYSQALALLTTLEKAQPDNPLLANLEGGAYIGLNDAVHARASFTRALTIAPTFMPAVQNLAQLDLQEKNPGAAQQRFLAVLEKEPKNVAAMTALATLAVSSGKPGQATPWLERAMAVNPGAIGPAVQLGSQYLRIGEKAKALALARTLLGTSPSNAQALDLLAQAQLASDDKTGARATYDKLIAVAPTSALARLRLAGADLALNDPAAAVTALQQAITLVPDYLEAQLALSTLLARQGDIPGALRIAKKIQQQRSQEAVGYVLEGDLLMMQKKAGAAIANYEKSVTLSSNPDSIVKLYQAMQEAGRGKEADLRLTKWVQTHPADLVSQMFQGEVLLSRNQNRPAITLFETLAQKMPDNAAVLNNLAYAYGQEKDGRALSTAEKAYQLGPANPAILDTLAWILVGQGQSERGLPLLQKAVALSDKAAVATPGTQQIRFHLATAMLRTGDKAGARKTLEELDLSGPAFPGREEAKAMLKTL